MRSDHRHLTAYQIACEVGQSVDLVLRPTILDRHILALDVTSFTNALPECGQIACTVGKRRAAEEPDHRHSRLLRARRERPCGRAAEESDECAPLCMSVKQHSEGRWGFGHDRLPVATGSPQPLRIPNRE